MKKKFPFLLIFILAAAIFLGSSNDSNKTVVAEESYFTPPSSKAESSSIETNSEAKPETASETVLETENFTREEVDHAFGTKPNIVFHPKKAINTHEAPSVAIKESASDNDPLHYYQITPDTYFLFGNIAEVDENNRGWNGNAGFVVTSDSVVVIDALGTPKLGRRMIATIKSVTDKPIKYLIVTHNHPDHAYGAIAFKRLGGVTIIGHEGTMKYIESDRIEHSVAYRSTFIKSDMQGFEAVKPDIMIGGDLHSKQSITTGGVTFDIYNTGDHHSFGDLAIHQRGDDIVWISDLAFNNRVTFMADGHSKQAIDAQAWLLETFPNADYMIPGHGSVQTAPFPMVTETRSYMQHLRDSMTKAIENDVELQEAVNNTEFENWKSVNMYGLNQKKNVDFVYRELEEELF